MNGLYAIFNLSIQVDRLQCLWAIGYTPPVDHLSQQESLYAGH
jgi:hypothetical protein